MFEYLKRKIARLDIKEDKIISYPRYYKENGKTIKETAQGEKWVVKLDSNYKEVLVEQIK